MTISSRSLKVVRAYPVASECCLYMFEICGYTLIYCCKEGLEVTSTTPHLQEDMSNAAVVKSLNTLHLLVG